MKVTVVGDSVAWGQGLLDTHKYGSIVNQTLGLATPPLMLAHSGATIGIRGATPFTAKSGEVPTSSPTVLEQVTAAPDPADAQVVLMNGGINDVNIRVILNPMTTSDELSHKTQRYCHDDMLALLQTATQRFTSPESRFVVSGYYPILSGESAPFRVPLLLATHGVSFTPFMRQETVFDKIVALSLQFWHESTDGLQRAVRDCGDARVSFADAGFTERNAVFATAPLLWGVKMDFSPQDEVVGDRHTACNVAFPLPLAVVERESCYRASAGHPNVAGAQQFAQAIVTSLAVV
jgi:lysophospholipase L1-like esterase